MFFCLLLVSIVTYAEYNVGFMEMHMSFSPQINPELSEALLADAFAKMDVDQDGFLSKEERKPFVTDIYSKIVQHIKDDSGEVVLRELFLNSVFVPDISAFGEQIEDKHCLMEQVFQEMDASSLWSRLFGETTHVPVELFVDTIFERIEPNRKASLQQALNTVKAKTDVTQRSSENLPIVKLDDYTKDMHNKACDKRRKLFIDGGVLETWVLTVTGLELEALISMMLEGVVYSFLQGAANCLLQRVAYDGCQSFKVFLLDWAMAAGVGTIWKSMALWFNSSSVVTAVGTVADDVVSAARWYEDGGQILGRVAQEITDEIVDAAREAVLEEATEDIVSVISSSYGLPGWAESALQLPCAVFC